MIQDPTTGSPELDPTFVAVGALVTENSFAGLTVDPEETTQDPLAAALQEKKREYEKPPSLEVTRSQGNAKIGNQIFQEWQRMQGVEVPKKSLPSREQAETLGATFKEMWAKNNPDMVQVIPGGATGQTVYQLTDQGMDLFEKGEAERKLLFPKQHVKPAKQPLPTGKLPGDVGSTVVKQTSGRVGKVEFDPVIEEAKRNLAQVPNVVDKTRAKILYQTLLPILATADHESWMADIHSIGQKKLNEFQGQYTSYKRRSDEARAAGVPFNEKPYDPVKNMQRLTNKLAQETRAIAQERNGANYLTYNTQAFNGRITPQQTLFNPTTSKAVRFVTRNATPVRIDKGGRTDNNIRQMYAMMLVKGADVLLPLERERALDAATPRLRAWGNRLKQALTMSDGEYEAVSQAITEGVPLTDQRFPQVQPLALDPEADAELINVIRSKGEDGPHTIDGLIDFATYMDKRDADKPHHSYFNAYIDGKTNGLASNGIQMGSFETAAATGVTRKGTKDLLDEGDIRDQLAIKATNSIDKGWDGNVSEFLPELNNIARTIFNHRQLNKDTTMTFGYGKEIPSFAQNISDTIDELSASNPELAQHVAQVLDVGKMTQSELSNKLLEKYREALTEVLSDDALDSRRLMRGSALLHAAMDEIMMIKSYTGTPLYLGANENTGEASQTQVRIYDQDAPTRLSVQHYEERLTSAAGRTRTDAQGEQQFQPGEYAYGGSLPGPVQSLDAATVAMSAAGPSWQKLKAKSNGKPYMHTIYDLSLIHISEPTRPY